MIAPLDKKMRLEWLQVLRGIAATMVVLCHMGMWEEKAMGAGAVAPHFLKSGESGVDIFFVISGFIMVFITPEKFKGASEWLAFLYRRFTRIFPPYWIVTGLLFLIWLRKPELFNNYYHNQMDIGRSFLLLPQSFTPLIAVGWSLIHEVYFYFVVSFVFWRNQFGRVAWLVGWFVTLLGLNIFGSAELFRGSPVMQLLLSPFSLEFQMGMIAAFTWKYLARLRLRAWFYVISASICLVGIYVSGGVIPSVGVYPDNNHLFRVAYYGLPAFILVAFVVQIDAGAFLKAPRWAVLAGDASYAIYLLHLPIINAAYKSFSAWVPHPNFCLSIIGFLAIVAASIASAMAFHLVIERRLISFFHRKNPF